MEIVPRSTIVFTTEDPTTAVFVLCTLESRIDVGQGINVGLGKFVKKNKRSALNVGYEQNVQIMLQKKHQTWKYL